MDFSNDSMCILFGILLAYVMDVFFSFINYFIEKALYYRKLRKDLKK